MPQATPQTTTDACISVLMYNPVSAMGGAEWSFLELARALQAEAGIEPVTAAPPGPLADRLQKAGVPVFRVLACRLHRPAASFRMVNEFVQAWRAMRCVRRLSEQLDPDLMYANGTTAALLLALGAAGLGTPWLWHNRDLSWPPFTLRQIGRRASATLAASNAAARKLRTRLPPRAVACLYTIPNGIDLGRFSTLPDRLTARVRLGLPQAGKLIGMVGHFYPWKRHDRFLRIAAEVSHQHADVQAVIAGSYLFGEHAALVSKLQEEALRLGIAGRLQWVQPGERMPEFYRALDVLVHPCPSEPFGRVICEAMAAGCPVSAVDAAGPAEILCDGVSGLLSAPGEPDQMIRSVMRILDEDGLRERLTANARRRVAERFDIRRTAADIADVCRQITGARRNEPSG